MKGRQPPISVKKGRPDLLLCPHRVRVETVVPPESLSSVSSQELVFSVRLLGLAVL